MWRARRRCPASTATWRSSSRICSAPRANWAPRCWRPAITSPRGRCRAAAARSIAPRKRSATRATSCSARRMRSSICLRFPLGDMGKAETRELARSFGLAVADKHDSQDICFVPTGRYTDVIERLKPGAAAAGDVVDMDGKVLGRHDGIIHFTIGQRRGLKIAGPAPLYVVALDADEAARRGRPARGADDAADRAARRQLDRRGRARSRARRRTDRGVRQGALDAAAARGVSVGHRRRHRDRTGRRRGRRVARPGLRVLRQRARARPACSAAASSAPRRRRRRAA